tara:strand:- start:64 stop:231 length:168 start_codon:yes stop_codon:yes gene_type:complete
MRFIDDETAYRIIEYILLAIGIVVAVIVILSVYNTLANGLSNTINESKNLLASKM